MASNFDRMEIEYSLKHGFRLRIFSFDKAAETNACDSGSLAIIHDFLKTTLPGYHHLRKMMFNDVLGDLKDKDLAELIRRTTKDV